MPLKKRLTLFLAKPEVSYGMSTGSGDADGSTILDANETWAADGVEIGDALIYKPLTADQEVTYVTAFDTGTNIVTVSPVISAQTVDTDLYEIVVDGGLAANEQSFAIAGTADAGSGVTTLIDAALNANDGFAQQGIKTGHQVYITGAGGLGGSGVITAIDHANDTLTITSITGVTTDSTFVIRPTPVLLFDVGHKFDIEFHERNPLRQTLTPVKSLPGKRRSTITANLELAGGTAWANFAAGTPAAGSLPAYDVLLRSCGFLPTIVASTSVAYNPISRGIPALTIATYENGIQKISLGCRGTATIPIETGKPGMLNLTISGIPKEVSSSLIADVAFPDGIIDPGIAPPQFQGVTLVDSDFVMDTMNVDLGMTVSYRPDMAASAGLRSTLATERKITATIDPEMLKKSVHDFYALMIAGTLFELNALAGATAGNKIQIGSPSGQSTAQYTEIDSDQEREQARVAAANIMFSTTSADAEFAIKIT